MSKTIREEIYATIKGTVIATQEARNDLADALVPVFERLLAAPPSPSETGPLVERLRDGAAGRLSMTVENWRALLTESADVLDRLRTLMVVASHGYQCATFKHGDGLTCDCPLGEMRQALGMTEATEPKACTCECSPYDGPDSEQEWNVDRNCPQHGESPAPVGEPPPFTREYVLAEVDEIERERMGPGDLHDLTAALLMLRSYAATLPAAERPRKVEGRCVACGQPIYEREQHHCPTPRSTRCSGGT